MDICFNRIPKDDIRKFLELHNICYKGNIYNIALNYIIDNFDLIELPEPIKVYFKFINLRCKGIKVPRFVYSQIFTCDETSLLNLYNTFEVDNRDSLIKTLYVGGLLEYDTNFFEIFPEEILVHIIGFLDTKTIKATNSLTKNISNIYKKKEISILRAFLSNNKYNVDNVENENIKSLTKNIVEQKSRVVSNTIGEYIVLNNKLFERYGDIYRFKINNISKVLGDISNTGDGIFLGKNSSIKFSDSLIKTSGGVNNTIMDVTDMGIAKSCVIFLKKSGKVFRAGTIDNYSNVDLKNIKELKEVGLCQKIVFGHESVCFLTVEGLVYYYGSNTHQIFGDEARRGPKLVEDISDVIDVVMTIDFILYLKSNGTVYFCGSNRIETPTEFIYLNDIIKITGNQHLGYAMAMNSKGEIFIILGNTLCNNSLPVTEDIIKTIKLDLKNVFLFSIGGSTPSLLLTANNHLYMTGYYDYSCRAMNFKPMLLGVYPNLKMLEYGYVVNDNKIICFNYYRKGLKIKSYPIIQ
jgi:hypothetical protein